MKVIPLIKTYVHSTCVYCSKSSLEQLKKLGVDISKDLLIYNIKDLTIDINRELIVGLIALYNDL